MSGVSCSDAESNAKSFFGKYKMFSDDPAVSRFIANEDNYLQVNKDKTIIYNSTINNKPKFNFKGEYSFEKPPGTLVIKWHEGQLPDTLKIEMAGNDHIIKIGDTFYKKITSN